MKNVRLAGRRYSDPDVLALVEAGGGLQDPRSLVLTQARKLNALYRRFEVSADDPMQRLKHIASLRGLTIEPMNVERRRSEQRDAVVIFNSQDQGKHGHIVYNPDRSDGRIAFSIAHEIAHTFFPSSSRGVRFREMCDSDSREANELERLCDLGAAELLMPENEFQASVASEWSMKSVARLAETFGSSLEATVFRLASAYPGIAAAGSLRFRRTKGDEAKLRLVSEAEQTSFFDLEPCDRGPRVAPPKYRRQAFHASDTFPASQIVPWNKSFDQESIVYQVELDKIYTAEEHLPNGTDSKGVLEVMHTPYQWEEADPEHPDILFYWRKVN